MARCWRRETAQQVTLANAGSQNWNMGSASINVAQRQQDLPDTQARSVQVGAVASMAATDRQLALISRQTNNGTVNASALNVSAPVETGHSLPMPSRNSGSGGITEVGTVNVDGASANPTTNVVPFVGNTVAAVAPVASQPLARVQGVPDTSFQSNPQKYLIETNPVLTELKQFMSSDYLLSNLGYDPDESQKRLGDGLYEQRLIQQAVVARTGQRFIDGQTSDEGLFKYLMNNAIASKDALNLSVGVSLTSQQVAALTHDIVWLEEHEVNGEKVLVPVLYLAQAEGRLGPTGALIAGNDVTLIAGQNLDNVGTLRASNNLSATAGKDLVNSGLIQAGNRLDVLAVNNIVNKSGGIIAGRDVNATTITGDIVNERTLTSSDNSTRFGTQHHDYADNAARIESANDLTMGAGQDINVVGGVLQSGRDMKLDAGRDVNVLSTQVTNSDFRDRKHNSSDITQLGASLDVGRDLSAQAGRDINVIASQVDAKRDIEMAATQNLGIGSAADEEHSLSKSKKVTRQEDHVSQVGSGVTAGGDVTLSAGKDMAIVSSRVSAGDEAYLVAGEKLEVLAAQDSDYSLYDKKKKGSWGEKQTQHDEVTKVTNVSSEITTGGDLTLLSGDDQRYQAAKLNSGNDLTIQSGGAITFEGVKDLSQESHTKSDTSLAWNSMKGKGHTDEALRQSQLVAKGDLVIKAVDGLNIDIKHINQQTVSQTIDVMVKADPELTWLKEAEQRGDVDWRLVKETHDSFKYSNSSLGQGAMLAIIIIVTVLTAGAASAAVGTAASATAGSGTAMAAAGTASASAVAGGATVGSTVAAGWGNIALTSAITSAASGAAISTINNKGNLGAVVKDVTSSDSLKNYAVAGVSGGLGGANIGARLAANAALKTIVEGGKFKDNLGQAAVGLAADMLAGAIYQRVGDSLVGSGLPTKVAVHAIVGGLIGEAAGGDFATSALAAGANKALVQMVGDKIFSGVAHDQALAMTSQLLGMVVAAGAGGSEKDQKVAGWVTGLATANNYLGHVEVEKLEGELIGCRYNPDPVACRTNVKSKFQVISDSKTGASLYDCKKSGEAACADQLADAQSGSASLDWLVGTSKLSSEERDIIEHFQDINHADDRVAYDPWKQTFWQESGAAGGVLSGVSGGIGAADRAAAANAYAEGKLSVELINSTMQPYKAGQVISNGGRAVTKHPEYFGFENTAELRKVYRSDAQLNELAENSIRDILRGGVKTTGVSGRYPDGWMTYTLPDGKAASWGLDGKFIGFRGVK